MSGRYEFDAERYADHSELDSNLARQHAGIDFRHEQSRLLSLSLDGGYTRTRRPEELSPDAGLELGRARAKRIFVGPSAEYRFDPLTVGVGSYDFVRDELDDGFASDIHSASLGVGRKFGRRDSGSIDYTIRRFLFEGAENTTAQLVVFGWSRNLTPLTTMTLRGGPRFSEGGVDPEISASLRHRFKRGELGFAYARSQGTVIGETGTVETEGFGLDVSYTAGPNLELSAAPSFAVTRLRGAEAEVYRLNLEARYEINRYLSFVGAWSYSRQQGSLDGVGGEVERNVISAGILLARPRR